MFQALLFDWKESVFIYFIWQHVFLLKYIIDKKERRERIDCYYLSKRIDIFIQFLKFLRYWRLTKFITSFVKK